MTRDGREYTGGLCVFDSEGEFGAYAFQWTVEKGAKDEELCARQAEAMLESFEITGP